MLSSTLLIGYYYNLLLKTLDSDCLVRNMAGELLTSSEKELILAGHSIYQKRNLLLGHVRHMKPNDLLRFCNLMKETTPEVSLQLLTGMKY